MKQLRFSSRFRAVAAAFLLVTVAMAVQPSGASAQVTVDRDQPAEPLIVFGFPKIGRVLEITERLTQLVGREDISEQFITMISGQFESMQLDPEQSSAQMMFLKPGFPPDAIGVFCTPVKDGDTDAYLEAFKKRFGWMRDATLKEVDGETGFFELSQENEEGNGFYQAVRIADGYAFTSSNRGFVELNMKGVAGKIAPITKANDLGFGVFPEAVPAGLRTVFVTFLRNAAEAELQQKDDEVEADYRARKATGDYFLDLAEEILNQSDGASFGLDFHEDGRVEINARIDAQKDSQLSDFLDHFGGRPSRFRKLSGDLTSDSLNISMDLDESTKEWLMQLVKSASTKISGELEIENYETHPVRELFVSLQKTLAKGHFDFLFQVVGQPRVGVVLMGAMHIEEGEEVNGAVTELLRMISEQTDEVIITLNAESHGGIEFHTVQPKNSNTDMNSFFGEPPSLWIGAGKSTIWFAFGGGETTFLELVTAVDIAAETPPVEEEGDTVAIRGNYNIGRWVGLMAPDESRQPETEATPELGVSVEAADESESPRRRRRGRPGSDRLNEFQRRMYEEVSKNVKDDEDNVQFIVKASKDGLRAELDMGPAFTKMYVSMGIAGFEMSQQRQQEARQRAEEEKAKQIEQRIEGTNPK